ncbi:MAG TPA: hypothetical protein VGI40_14735 [Pirellulaceae bacterium]|jgi:hypothetical protein
MTNSSHSRHARSAGLLGWGTARADLAAIAGMRKKLPAWAPADTPGHFLKYSDEQTVLAVAAVDQAISSAELDAKQFQNWSIVAAPRFIGRVAGVGTLARFDRGGGPAISPHVIPQHSLHSISGALSILLSSRQPNFGVGGTGDSLAEGLFAALTFPAGNRAGVLLVATAWEPEPQLDAEGNCTNAPVCHAVALAVEATATTKTSVCGNLHLSCGDGSIDARRTVHWFENAAGLCNRLSALIPGGPAGHFAWRLPWGAMLVLEARESIVGLKAAA